jgi:hypothetical protein
MRGLDYFRTRYLLAVFLPFPYHLCVTFRVSFVTDNEAWRYFAVSVISVISSYFQPEVENMFTGKFIIRFIHSDFELQTESKLHSISKGVLFIRRMTYNTDCDSLMH